MENNNLPKKIWFLWLQGLDNAPIVVRKCYESWAKRNPGWQVILLDERNLANYISIKSRDITSQAFSDISRINLLAKYGGVWVDATCFCNVPLDEWLQPYMKEGFFAFERPAPDRMLSSWFLACYEDNYTIAAYQKIVNSYWDKNPRLTAFESSGWRRLFRRLQRRSPRVWFRPMVTKVLRVYPYFWFHYLFEILYTKDKDVRRAWGVTPKFSADIPHNLQFAGLFNPLRHKVKSDIDDKVSPVYKLTWKYDKASYKEGCILDYLLSTVN